MNMFLHAAYPYLMLAVACAAYGYWAAGRTRKNARK
jgi:hypothetical protein